MKKQTTQKYIKSMHDTKEKAVAAWNRRVNNDKA